ncbi:MAG: polysaccharide deacetylase family protein [Candidatus Pacebacteria bacterium]|nr:polysaccharide deacetylase family protein [Candidatus Paceibacterota bacterium]MCF7856938.1 polysaccharide deacetylase family protein [Candidatus Paceibacterota bacterium]
MKKYLRNNFISFVSHVGLSYIYRTLKKREGSLVRVLVFHDVQDASWFENMMTSLNKRYNLLTPDSFLKKQYDSNRINVLITFDDGYLSWVDVCLPILKEKGIKALFFINSGLIDVFEHQDIQEQYIRGNLLLSPRKTLSWDGVKKLHEAGHMIGGHTTTHPRLSELHEDRQRETVVQDKKRIEEILNTSIRTFAYPFGQRNDYTPETVGIVKESGYTHSFTTEGVFVNAYNQFEFSRLCVEDGLSIGQLKQWIEGGYDLYHKIKTLCVR